MKRMIFCTVLVLLLCISHASAYSASAYAVLAADTGILLDGSRENVRLPMASTTKIMTGWLAAEENLDRTIRVPASCAGVEGSSMYLKAGECLPLREVLYGLMLHSGNDAAECIAAVCGGREVFVARMNERARQLALTQTHFENPSGLDGAGHYTTAQELAKLSAAALKNPVFADAVSSKTYTSETRTMTNHNKMLKLYPDAIGVKTGYTRTAGRCLVSAAKRNGRTVVAVTLNDRDDWNDHIHMLDQAFDGMQMQTLAKKGDCAAQISVQTGMQPHVSACMKSDLTAWLLNQEEAELRLYSAPFLYAPVKKGTVCGYAQVVCGGTVLDETPLICGSSVAVDAEQEDTGIWERFRLWTDDIRGITLT